MPVAVEIRRISAEETIRIRHKVLWPSIPINEQLLKYDIASTTIHLGAFLVERDGTDASITANLEAEYWPPREKGDAVAQWPLGNLTITHESFPKPEKLNAELRQLEGRQVHKFGVHDALQGHGVGGQLFEAAIQTIRESLVDRGNSSGKLLLHLDCRRESIRFYQRHGMQLVDDEVFVKRGPNGNGPEIEYIRMGIVIAPE